MNAIAAGVTTPQSSSVVDTMGFEGVRFIFLLGATVAGGVPQCKVQDGAAANLSDAADVLGSGYMNVPSTDDNQVTIVDVYRPRKRYLRAQVIRGTQNTTIDGIIAELYEGDSLPKAKDATVASGKILVSAIDGTA
jgi:hypothetical protein